MTPDRRGFLLGTSATAGIALASIGSARRAGAADAAITIQQRIDRIALEALRQTGTNAAIVVGIVSPDAPGGQLLFAGQDGLVNPFGARLVLDAQTPFEIGSISKVFTSAIHYMMHGPYEGTLRASIGSRLPLSPAVGGLRLANLATYQPGLAQDNQGGVYPRDVTAGLRNLFDYMADFTPLPAGHLLRLFECRLDPAEHGDAGDRQHGLRGIRRSL